MSGFKVGDRVVKARHYSGDKYCNYGGGDSEVPLGTEGVIKKIVLEDVINVDFETGFNWNVDGSEIDLVNKIKEIKMKNYEIIVTDKEVSIIDSDKDCITLTKSDFKKIYKEIKNEI